MFMCTHVYSCVITCCRADGEAGQRETGGNSGGDGEAGCVCEEESCPSKTALFS